MAEDDGRIKNVEVANLHIDAQAYVAHEDVAFADLVCCGVSERCFFIYDVGEGDEGVGDGLADVFEVAWFAVGYADVDGGGPGVEVLHAADADAVLELGAFGDAVVKEADEVPFGVLYYPEQEAVNLASKSSSTVYCEIFHVGVSLCRRRRAWWRRWRC